LTLASGQVIHRLSIDGYQSYPGGLVKQGYPIGSGYPGSRLYMIKQVIGYPTVIQLARG